MQRIINVSSGCPIANIPAGIQSNGLPFGLSIFADRFREDLLLRAMSAFEVLYPKKIVPKTFRKDAHWPTIEMDT